MLHLPTSFHVDLTLNHEAQGVWGTRRRLVLHKRAGESEAHVLMKLLAYLVFFHPELRIEVHVGQHYKPDLVRLDAQGEPVQWVDCGRITLTKLDRISRKNRRTLIDVVKPDPHALRTYAQSAAGRLAFPERVRLLAFRAGFLEALAAALPGRAGLAATVSGAPDHLYLDVEGRALDTELFWGSVAGRAPA